MKEATSNTTAGNINGWIFYSTFITMVSFSLFFLLLNLGGLEFFIGIIILAPINLFFSLSFFAAITYLIKIKKLANYEPQVLKEFNIIKKRIKILTLPFAIVLILTVLISRETVLPF